MSQLARDSIAGNDGDRDGLPSGPINFELKNNDRQNFLQVLKLRTSGSIFSESSSKRRNESAVRINIKEPNLSTFIIYALFNTLMTDLTKKF